MYHPPAAKPRHLAPLLPGLRGWSAASNDNSSTPTILLSHPTAPPPPATILHKMFNTCVTRGIGAKLVKKTVELSLHSSIMTPAAAASIMRKRKRKRPDNGRHRTQRDAWHQRCSEAAVAAPAKFSTGPRNGSSSSSNYRARSVAACSKGSSYHGSGLWKSGMV
jgi:hypothetical protein